MSERYLVKVRGKRATKVDPKQNKVITVRLDGELYNKLVDLSEKLEVSLNLLCIVSLEKEINNHVSQT